MEFVRIGKEVVNVEHVETIEETHGVARDPLPGKDPTELVPTMRVRFTSGAVVDYQGEAFDDWYHFVHNIVPR